MMSRSRSLAQFARQSSSSTSAISYKRTHPRKRHPALSSEYLYPAAPSAEEAVSNILYNTPAGGRAYVQQRHIFNCLVQNEPGVLSRVSGILAGRGFNIDSLVVAKTEVADLSRMTIVLRGDPETIEQARRQVEDLVSVLYIFFEREPLYVWRKEREILFYSPIYIIYIQSFFFLLSHSFV